MAKILTVSRKPSPHWDPLLTVANLRHAWQSICINWRRIFPSDRNPTINQDMDNQESERYC